MIKNNNDLHHVKELLETISTLRSPDGCPWDREQTHASLKKYLIEESYEVIEAIDNNSSVDLLEELGDLLFQICIHAEIEAEKGNFDFCEVAKILNQKMITRHPHVFEEGKKLDSANKVIDQWEEIKKREKPERELSPFSGIPKELPSLMRANKVYKKASKLKLTSPAEQTTPESHSFSNSTELGDLLLQIAVQATKLKLDPEEALRQAVLKLQSDFESQVLLPVANSSN